MCSIPGRLSCTQFLSSSKVHSEVPSECLSKLPQRYEKRPELCITRGLKLFMLLHDCCCSDLEEVAKSPKKALEERVQLFQEGRWLELLAFCRETERPVHQSSVRRSR